MTRVVLHIDRLVLRGVDRSDAQAVSAALEARLHALLSADGGTALRQRTGSHRLKDAPVPAGTGATALGHAVADRIAGASAPVAISKHGSAR